MLLLLILPILVSGFILCNCNLRYYFKLHRYDGQLLYLKSAQLGLTTLLIVTAILFFISASFPSQIVIFGASLSLDAISFLKSLLRPATTVLDEPQLTSFSWVVLLSIFTVITAYIRAEITNYLFKKKAGTLEKAKILLMHDVLRDRPLDNLLFQSYIHSKPVMLTLGSRKVYVGTTSSLGEPNEINGMSQLFP